MLHIAVLIPTLAKIGGAENQALLLAEGLAKRGWRVTLIALAGDVSGAKDLPDGITPLIYQKLSRAGVQLLSLHMRKAWVDARGWRIFIKWFRINRPEIMHAHLPHATWFARWARLFAPTQVVLESLHTGRTASPRARLGYRLSSWLSNRTTCVSAAVGRMALESGLLRAERLTVIPNGIPIGSGSGCEEEIPWRDASQPFRWVAVGRLAPVKDYSTLLQAFSQLGGSGGFDASPSKPMVKPELTILGAGEEESALRELTTSLGLLDQVHIAGFVCDVQPFLRASDAFVLSSRWEGLPVGVLEAQAAGLPVVATNGSGTAEAMLDGQTGFLIPVGDVCALTGAMEKMMSLPVTQRQHMGNMARNFVSDRFSLDRILDQWEKLYQELLREQPQASRWTRLKFNQSASVEYVKAASAAASVPVEASPPGHTCVDGDSRPPPVRK